MSMHYELGRLAKLLRDAASQIALGVEGSFADEEHLHPMSRGMRSTQRRCERQAAIFEAMSRAGGAADAKAKS